MCSGQSCTMHGFLDVNECDDEDGSEDGNDGDESNGCDSGNGRKLEGCEEGNGSENDDACKCTSCEDVQIVENCDSDASGFDVQAFYPHCNNDLDSLAGSWVHPCPNVTQLQRCIGRICHYKDNIVLKRN